MTTEIGEKEIKKAAEVGNLAFEFYCFYGRFPTNKDELLMVGAMKLKRNNEEITIPKWLFDKFKDLYLILDIEEKGAYCVGRYEGFLIKSEVEI